MKRKHGRRDASSLAFTTRFLRRSRELYRRYLEAKPWVRQLYKEFLNLRPGLRVVDVGCGTGDFTRYLAELAGPDCEIIGIDSRPSSVKAAIRETKRLKLGNNVSYRIGDAYSLPVDNNYSDLTCCRTLLIHLKEPSKAIEEIARVTRAGGVVAAIERGRMNSFYDPDDDHYNELSKAAGRCYVKGLQRLEGKDFVIGDRLPRLFSDAGLQGIRAEVQADAWVPCDSRRKFRDVKDMLRFEFETFQKAKEAERKILLAGGMPHGKVREYFSYYERRARTLLSRDKMLRKSCEFYVAGFYIVTGVKAAN